MYIVHKDPEIYQIFVALKSIFSRVFKGLKDIRRREISRIDFDQLSTTNNQPVDKVDAFGTRYIQALLSLHYIGIGWNVKKCPPVGEEIFHHY